VINYTLSNSIEIVCALVTITAIISFLPKFEYVTEVMSIGVCSVPIALTIASVVGGGYAIRGSRFKNVLIHPFVSDQ
jgi:hypothetical protein